jgi:hypothetical protein
MKCTTLSTPNGIRGALGSKLPVGKDRNWDQRVSNDTWNSKDQTWVLDGSTLSVTSVALQLP